MHGEDEHTMRLFFICHQLLLILVIMYAYAYAYVQEHWSDLGHSSAGG